jgi:hypothetical protein
MGLGLVISVSIIHMDLHKPKNKLVSAKLEHFWCTDSNGTPEILKFGTPPTLEGHNFVC